MNLQSVILSAVVVVLAMMACADAEQTCKQVLGELTKRQLKGITTCTKSMKFKNGKEKSKKMNCILKCAMANEGLLSAEGKVETDTFLAFLERVMPKFMHENAKKAVGGCLEKFADKLDPTEEYCTSYDPLIKCFMMSLPQLCP